MSVRQTSGDDWTVDPANDNALCRTVAAEGVVQCLQFLANEADCLGFAKAAGDILRAAFQLQADLGSEHLLHTAPVQARSQPDRPVPVVLAPSA